MHLLKTINIFLAFGLLMQVNAYAQGEDINTFNSGNINWYNKDPKKDRLMGASVDKVYDEFITLNSSKTKKPSIIVAVIDGGVDIHHEDLKGKIWVNEDEIPDNGIDDDNNGYVDDVNGWNFLGNQAGENINFENYEFTRIIREGDSISSQFQKASLSYRSSYQQAENFIRLFKKFIEQYENAQSFIYEQTGIRIEELDDLKKVKANSAKIKEAKKQIGDKLKIGFTPDNMRERMSIYEDALNYHLNLNFDPRRIIGDNPSDINDTNYGNADIIGESADHGTLVAGIIAANRNNNIGINGIASNAKIMVLRAVPDGDERDKDIALSIKYAVDNGARIINMSFGKSFSPQKAMVDEAVKYAASKGVLLVHAAGNDGVNVDTTASYPNRYLLNYSKPTNNWITVGASRSIRGKNIAARFSNYGKINVDLFSPGVNIVSTDISNTYSMVDGTSFAAPVVSGVAALLLQEFPNLNAQELAEILKNSTYPIKRPKQVRLPSPSPFDKENISFEELSKTGGIINAYKAFQLAQKEVTSK